MNIKMLYKDTKNKNSENKINELEQKIEELQM